MKYSYEYEIKYQEVDGQKKLRLYNLENYLLEVAGTVADDLGFGIQVLHPMGITWILTHLSVIMYELPTHCEKIRFETWIESNLHMLSTRDYRIYSGDKLIGICKSVWAVLDLQKREIVNCFDLPIFHDCVDGEFLNIDRLRMSAVTNPTGVATHKIVYSDIDYNGHCNSCRYLQAMTDAYRAPRHQLHQGSDARRDYRNPLSGAAGRRTIPAKERGSTDLLFLQDNDPRSCIR